jgi:LAS superfamily LD-carboxypeptidase LdcB
MNRTEPTGMISRRGPRSIAVAVVAAATTLTALFMSQSSSSDAAVPDVSSPGGLASTVAQPTGRPPVVPQVSEDRATSGLDPDLAAALQRATAHARDDGVDIEVTSGWRSAEHQQRLLLEAIGRYGSKEEAARWVATPETSPHVSGDAIDVGPKAATDWLAQHGAAYGLCQIYANESWHYELRPSAVDDGCPAMYADPTHDPRMR